MRRAYIVSGSLTDSRTVQLDEPALVPGGRVRVIVEVDESTPRMTHEEFLAWLQQRQNVRGHVPLSPDAVAAYLKAERESWGD